MLYKILAASLWAEAASRAELPWAPADLRDGFVHLSGASQLRETARRHFTGQRALVLLTIDPARLDAGTLRWEPSRGGALFPHVHGPIPLEAVVRAEPLVPIEGGWAFPDGIA